MNAVENISREIKEKLKTYQELLVKWQEKINLVSSHSIEKAWERHFVDSMQLEALLPENAKTLFDFGCGAGFPGLVLAMMNPSLEVHLVESDQKKCSFLRAVSRETEAPVHIHSERIEAFSVDAVPDVITARALASLVELFSYCERWIERNPDLVLIFPKGARADEELSALEKVWRFDLCTHASQTHEEAKILIFSKIYKM